MPEFTIAAEAIGVTFGGGLHALSDVTMKVQPGSVTAVIGPNGSGKSTLVNVLSGAILPTSGVVSYQDRVMRRWTLSRAARAGVARTFQAPQVFFEFSVEENLRIASRRTASAAPMADLLQMVALERRASTRASDLSYGELRRLGVAIALAVDPRVLLLDEPGAGLSEFDLDELSKLIHRIQAQGVGVLLIDHNMRFLMNTADHVVVLEAGRVISEGSPEVVRADERVISAYLGRS